MSRRQTGIGFSTTAAAAAGGCCRKQVVHIHVHIGTIMLAFYHQSIAVLAGSTALTAASTASFNVVAAATTTTATDIDSQLNRFALLLHVAGAATHMTGMCQDGHGTSQDAPVHGIGIGHIPRCRRRRGSCCGSRRNDRYLIGDTTGQGHDQWHSFRNGIHQSLQGLQEYRQIQATNLCGYSVALWVAGRKSRRGGSTRSGIRSVATVVVTVAVGVLVGSSMGDIHGRLRRMQQSMFIVIVLVVFVSSILLVRTQCINGRLTHSKHDFGRLPCRPKGFSLQGLFFQVLYKLGVLLE